MAENLFPEGLTEETVDEESITNAKKGYWPGAAFDYDLGDFPRDGRNRILDATGIASWKIWVTNCLQTERYAHLAYNSDFGIEYDKVFAAESREEAESILTRQITEAIMADPYKRAAYIEEIEYTWTAADAVQVDATIVGIDDVPIDITAYITGGEQ